MPGPDFASQDYAVSLAIGRAHTASLHASRASRPPRPQPQGSPQDARVPPPPSPPSAYALNLAAGRAHNAARLAALARGEQAGGR